MTTIFVRNADRMLTQVSLVNDAIEFTFADGVGGRIPLSELPGIRAEADITEIQLPDPYMIVVRGPGKQELEIPWDFARGRSDPLYRAAVEAVTRSGRQILGQRIRRLRESSGLTQDALARSAGIARVTIVRIENGEFSPRFETLVALAQALHRSTEEVLAPEISRAEAATEEAVTLAEIRDSGPAGMPPSRAAWRRGTSLTPDPDQPALAA